MVEQQVQRTRRRLHVALVYNGDREGGPDRPEDRGGELVGVGVALAYLARARTVNVAPRMVLAELETASKA